MAPTTRLEAGDTAPAFTLPDADTIAAIAWGASEGTTVYGETVVGRHLPPARAIDRGQK